MQSWSQKPQTAGECVPQKHPADRRPGPGLKAHAVPAVRDHLTPLSDPGVCLPCTLPHAQAAWSQSRHHQDLTPVSPCAEEIAQQADAALKDAEASVLPREAADGMSSPEGAAEHQPQKPLRDCSGRSNVPADPAQTAAGKQAVGNKARSAKSNMAKTTSKQLDCG